MGRADRGLRLGLLILLANHADERRQLGVEDLLVGIPDRDRIDVEEVVNVLAQPFLELGVNTIARAVTDERAELQAVLARLAMKQRDVRVVTGMEDDVGPRSLEL